LLKLKKINFPDKLLGKILAKGSQNKKTIVGDFSLKLEVE